MVAADLFVLTSARDWRAVGEITEYMDPSNNVRGYIARAVAGGCVLSLILLPLPCERGEPLRGKAVEVAMMSRKTRREKKGTVK